MKKSLWKILKKLKDESAMVTRTEEAMFYQKKINRIIKHYNIIIDCNKFHGTTYEETTNPILA